MKKSRANQNKRREEQESRTTNHKTNRRNQLEGRMPSQKGGKDEKEKTSGIDETHNKTRQDNP